MLISVLPASDDKSHLLIYFANILDPDKTSVWFQTVDTLMVFQEVFAAFIFKSTDDKTCKTYPAYHEVTCKFLFNFSKKKYVYKKGENTRVLILNELREIDKMRGLPD